MKPFRCACGARDPYEFTGWSNKSICGACRSAREADRLRGGRPAIKPSNRILPALLALGGSGTVHDIRSLVQVDRRSLNAQLSGMAKRGALKRAGTATVVVRRGRTGTKAIPATIWSL